MVVCVCVCVQYKTEKDGVIETRIEKRLVISGTTASDVDHDKVYSTPHWHLPVSQHLPVLEHLPVSALASTEKTREINLFNAVPKTFKDAKFTFAFQTCITLSAKKFCMSCILLRCKWPFGPFPFHKLID